MTPVTYTWSPSQINDYNDCARKWAFKSIAKIKPPQASSAALGTEIHKQLETYLAGGQLDYTKESAYIAVTGVHHLPAPQSPGLTLEGFFKFQSPETGYWYNGYRDFYIPAEYRPEKRPLVGDHKSTSNLSWAKKPEDLDTDPQAIIYARNEQTDVDIDLLWVYYQTRDTRKSLPVARTLTRKHVLKVFSELELTTDRMRSIVDESKLVGAAEPGELEKFIKETIPLPSSLKVCQKYGGCPYRSICNIGPEQRISSLFGNELKTMESQMSEGVQSLIARIKAGSGAEAVLDHGPSRGQDVFSTDFVNPPPQEDPIPAVLDVKEATTIIPPPMDAEPKKRTRKTKAENPVPRVVEVDAPKPASIQAPAQNAGYTLYVDCAPNEPSVDVVTYVQAAKEAVCERTGKPDYRLVEFGQGSGLLAIAMEDMIKEGQIKGNLLVNTQTQESLVVLSVLLANAAKVVRAFR